MKPLHRMLPWLAILLAGLGASWIRYEWIESAAFGQRCLAGDNGWACQLRAAIVSIFLAYGFGWAALVALALALLRRRPWTAALAATGGIVALVLYCVDAGALALLAGALCLLRRQSDPRAPALVQQR